MQVELRLELWLWLRLRLVNGQTNDQLGKWLMSDGGHPRVRQCFFSFKIGRLLMTLAGDSMCDGNSDGIWLRPSNG